MKQAYVALGSNLGNRAENLNRAVWALSLLPDTKVRAASRVYETEPVGFLKQDKFYNAVVRLETELSPQALLGACLGIEAGMGRVRGRKNGPRIIDLDLLLYEGVELQSRELTLPHPRMNERAFMLAPLLDLYSDRARKALFRDMDASGVKCVSAQIILP